MDVNPYESPSEIEEPSLSSPTPTGPVWIEVLYLALTALVIVVLIPASIVLCILVAT